MIDVRMNYQSASQPMQCNASYLGYVVLPATRQKSIVAATISTVPVVSNSQELVASALDLVLNNEEKYSVSGTDVDCFDWHRSLQSLAR